MGTYHEPRPPSGEPVDGERDVWLSEGKVVFGHWVAASSAWVTDKEVAYDGGDFSLNTHTHGGTFEGDADTVDGLHAASFWDKYIPLDQLYSYAGGSGWAGVFDGDDDPFRIRRFNGTVYLKGKYTIPSSGALIANLPAFYRPSAQRTITGGVTAAWKTDFVGTSWTALGSYEGANGNHWTADQTDPWMYKVAMVSGVKTVYLKGKVTFSYATWDSPSNYPFSLPAETMGAEHSYMVADMGDFKINLYGNSLSVSSDLMPGPLSSPQVINFGASTAVSLEATPGPWDIHIKTSGEISFDGPPGRSWITISLPESMSYSL